MFSLTSSIKNYKWGKFGNSSLISKLIVGGNNTDFNNKNINKIVDVKIDKNLTYAELWMGTHKNGPSYINSKNTSLSSYINTDLPYLFKVLSIGNALSIQAHPDKKTAEQLNKLDPINYPDDNHKPEMVIALSKFEMLCKFKSLTQLQYNLINNIELQNLILDKESLNLFIKKPTKILLKKIFKSFIQAPLELVETNIIQLINIINNKPIKSETDLLILNLNNEYKNDIGIFCVYFMNHIILDKNESVFIGANEPHAYIHGDCIECMANSDNVVRMGLTKKFVDKKTLYNILSYNTDFPIISSGVRKNKYLTLYNSPVNEFDIEKIVVKDSPELYNLSIQNSHSIMIVLSGRGFILSGNDYIYLTTGSIVYLEKNIQSKITCSSEYDDLVIYRVV